MTSKQLKLLDFINTTFAQLGKGPTYAEMREHMKVGSSQAIRDWLNILERQGYIRQTGTHRGIAPTNKGLHNEKYQLADMKSERHHARMEAGGSDNSRQSPDGHTKTNIFTQAFSSYVLKGGENSGTT